MNSKELEEAKTLMKKQAENTRSWANMADEEDALRPPAPPSAPATYKAKTYLPGASSWAAKQATVEEEASAERADTPTPLRNSNIEDIERNKRAYNLYTDRMGLPRRASRTPSRERRRRSNERRRTARRRRSPSPRGHSPRRRSPSPRYSRRRGSRNASPLRYTIAPNGRTVNEFGRNVPDRRHTQRNSPRFNGTRRPYKPANWNV